MGSGDISGMVTGDEESLILGSIETEVVGGACLR